MTSFWFFAQIAGKKLQKMTVNRVNIPKLTYRPYTKQGNLWYTNYEHKIKRGGRTMSVLDVARYVVTRANKQGRPVSNLKLQKILYFLWVEFFRFSGKPLFSEDICAWPLGPVCPEVYYEFCSYGGTPITREYDISLTESVSDIIDPVLDDLLDCSASYLVSKTHQSGSAWDIIFSNGEGNRQPIPFSLIETIEC